MFAFRFAALASLAVVGLHAPAGAQTIQSVGGPAERPPASYTAKQYVDSRGCIFVRAGYAGAVTWVPRVNRSGKVICNARPSRVARTEPSNPQTAPGERPKTDLSGATARATPKKVVRTQTPQKTVVVTAPARQVRTTAPVKTAPSPKRIVVQKPRVVTAPAAPLTVVPSAPRTARPACDYGGVANRYVNSGSNLPVRCGPQAENPNGNPVIGAPGNGSWQSGALRVPAPRPVTMPAGYKPVWDDDRLNPKRGVGTLSGAIATSLVWTNTVPRRLIDTRTGRDVTLKYAYLIYPYTDYATQKAALSRQGVSVETVTVSTGGSTIVPVTKSSRSPTALRTQTVTKSTRTAPRSSLPQAEGKPSYIRIGVFRDMAQKDRALARLRALGVPVRVGRMTQSGAPAMLVVVGPYGAREDLTPLLARIQAAGFASARIRN